MLLLDPAMPRCLPVCQGNPPVQKPPAEPRDSTCCFCPSLGDVRKPDSSPGWAKVGQMKKGLTAHQVFTASPCTL